jgi:signal peptidase II
MDEATSSPRRLVRLRAPSAADFWFLGIAAVVVLFDQLTKWAIAGWLERGESFPEGWPVRLVHITNSGAAFGMLQDSGPLLVIVSSIGIAVILIYLLNPGFAHPLLRLGLCLMFGGAVGNLIDRVFAGEVIDFVKFPNFPAFNVADSAITIGVLLLIWVILFDQPETADEEAS